MPKPVVGGRSLVVLVRLSSDQEYVILGMARNRHNAMVGNLLKINNISTVHKGHEKAQSSFHVLLSKKAIRRIEKASLDASALSSPGPITKSSLAGRRGPGLNLPSMECEYSVVA